MIDTRAFILSAKLMNSATRRYDKPFYFSVKKIRGEHPHQNERSGFGNKRRCYH